MTSGAVEELSSLTMDGFGCSSGFPSGHSIGSSLDVLGLEHCEWKYQLQAMLMMVAVDSKVDLA